MEEQLFEQHVKALTAARKRRRESLAFKSAVEFDEEDAAAAGLGPNADQKQDMLEGLGVWLPGVYRSLELYESEHAAVLTCPVRILSWVAHFCVFR